MLDEMIVPFLTSLWGRRLCWIALGMIGLLLLVTLIKTPFVWYSDSQLIKSSIKTTELPRQTQSLDLIQEIPTWHLFGSSAKDTSILPITSLQLRLIGIVKAVPENKSSVIISEAGQIGKVYLIGNTLPIGVKVDAIIEDGVILENAGRLEKLPLQRQPLSFQGMPRGLNGKA